MLQDQQQRKGVHTYGLVCLLPIESGQAQYCKLNTREYWISKDMILIGRPAQDGKAFQTQKKRAIIRYVSR